MGRLENQAVVITGAARGQGATEARQAAAEGTHVVVADVLDDLGQAIASEVDGTYHRLDMTSSAARATVIDQVIGDHGRIDGLVNNAGIFRNDDVLGGNEDNFRLITEVNQLGVFLGIGAVAPHMRDQESGSIVNISSIAGLRGRPTIA